MRLRPLRWGDPGFPGGPESSRGPPEREAEGQRQRWAEAAGRGGGRRRVFLGLREETALTWLLARVLCGIPDLHKCHRIDFCHFKPLNLVILTVVLGGSHRH